ncbi:hypothetical protein [Streptomyces pakalii]|uniref:Secreted protein n=1 Tax=Streptomyces pakalii TaxID=3036494 RepID=A0ABT7CZR5_9ACTN|nr:hypothetical protein [Streptomyces pakalii]MDJ1639037.1 hypothetical protein [Streptomyces pakalii]
MRRLLAIGAAIGAVVFAGTAALADNNGQAPRAVDTPPVAVEDFAYPQADKIFKEQGILLKRGDGHIVLADCASATDLLEVWARGKDRFCFRVTGDQGYLSLELPAVYGVKGNAYETEVNMTVEGEEKTFEVDKNAWTPVGETADPEERDHLLLEIVSTK